MSFLAPADTAKAAADDMVTMGDLAEAHREIKDGGGTPILMLQQRSGEEGQRLTTQKIYEGDATVGVALLLRSESHSFDDLQTLLMDHVNRCTDKDPAAKLGFESVDMYEGTWGRKEVLVATYEIIQAIDFDVS
jgi:hypothetical protein